jgi:hypothetical protein
MKTLKKKTGTMTVLLLLLMSMILVSIVSTINTVAATYGKITVQYLDGAPRPYAAVWIIGGDPIGTTDSNGQVDCTGFNGTYNIKAVYQGSRFGPETVIPLPEGGSITADYEITPPTVTILSPQPRTYDSSSIPLTFSVYDYSIISWTGYILDGQANITSGNTILTVAEGSHNVIVYANDTFGNMGSSQTVYFSYHEPPPPEVHDIAVTNVTVSKTVIGKGFTSNVTFLVVNKGDYPETFNVTAYCHDFTTDHDVFNGGYLSLNPSESTNKTFTWNTTDFAYDNYTMTITASNVPGETYTSDNNCTMYNLTVTIPGDINGDFKVQLLDLVLLAHAYSSKPGDINWNTDADIDGNGIVGLSDLVALAQHYGQHYP